MIKITLPKDEMLAILDSGADVVRDQIVSHGRWTVGHELIFRRDGKLYRTHYQRGATESQDEGPWEYTNPVICTEVIAVEKTVVDYTNAPEAEVSAS